MSVIGDVAPSADGRGLRSVFRSAVPMHIADGSALWGPRDSELRSSPPTEFVRTASQVGSETTATLASGAARPTLDDRLVVSGKSVSSRAARLAALWDRLMRFVREAAEQDSDGGTAVSDKTMEQARQLLAELPETIEFPQVTVSSDGEIIFTWFRSDDRMDAILAPDDHLTWVFRLGDEVTDGDVIVLDDNGVLGPFYKAVADFYE